MKITFLVSGNIRSNFSYRALALAESLHKLGVEVSIIAPKADKYNSFISEKISTINGVKILQPFQFATRHLEINLVPYLFGAARALLREKPDLVYIYKSTPISVVGLVSKLFRETPVVVDIDDLGSEVMKIEGHPWYQRSLVAWSERLAIQHADRLVVASSHLLDIYGEQFPNKPIHLMPNGVDVSWLGPPVASQTPKQIIFMGSINRKNIVEPLFDVMPNILKHIPETKVLMIGDGRYLSYFKEKSERLGLKKNVSFTGWLELSEARMRLREGDIGYNYMPNEPTIKAASNMKVSQYMARGVVPVVSDISDLVASADYKKMGYVAKANDLQALETTLLYALEDSGRLQKAKQTRLFAVQNFNWDNLAAGFYQWLGPSDGKRKKRIYVVATTIPGDVGGQEIRDYNLIKQLTKRLDADIHVFCISSESAEDSLVASKNFESKFGVRCHVAIHQSGSFLTTIRTLFFERVPPFMGDFRSSGIGDRFREACESALPDIVQIEQLDAYYCIRPHIAWLKSRGVKIILDCHNVEFQQFDNSLSLFPFSKRLVGRFLLPRLKDLEIEAAERADMVFACSAADVDFFKGYNPKTYLITNGVDSSEFRPAAKTNAPVLIFMGGVSYPPNGDAMQFYLSAIHPKVKERVPGVRLLAVGTNPEWMRSLGMRDDESVKTLGFVEDVRPYLDQAVIGICPLRYGAGTRIKILTYMAAGLPVVSTRKGAEGVGYADGHDILLNDDPGEFADAVVSLLNDRTRREEIGQNGRNFVLEHYDWDVIGKELARLYQDHA